MIRDLLVPPHDLDAEAIVLSAVLLSQEAFDDVQDFLRPEHFYLDSNRRIFEAVRALQQDGRASEVVDVAGWLRSRGHLEQVGGSPYLAELVNDTPSVARVEERARIVTTKAKHRAALASLQRLVAEGHAPGCDTAAWLERVDQTAFQLLTESNVERHDVHASEVAAATLNIIGERAKPDGDRDYLPTGLNRVNKAAVGWDLGLMHVIAARPGVGKTSYALREAVELAGRRHNEEIVGSVVFSMEMPWSQLMERALVQQSLVSADKVRCGELTPEEFGDLVAAAQTIGTRPLIIDDTPALSVATVRSRLRRYQAMLTRRHGPSVRIRVVVIDYLQLMHAEGHLREERVAAISRGLREVAKEFGVALIAVAALNREQTKGAKDGEQRRPQLSDLRESGQIEYDAASVGFLFNRTSNKPEAQRSSQTTLIFAKMRRGPAVDVTLSFDGEHQLFVDPSEAQMRMWDQQFGARYDDFGGDQ